MGAEMTRDDWAAFQEMASGFAKRSIRPILEHESPDGDLDRVPAVLKEAHETGLLASPDPDAPGFETGVWGRHALSDGPLLSLRLLSELAHACGGVAMSIHAAGLAALVIGMAENAAGLKAGRAAVALSENGFPPGFGTILDPSRAEPARIETVAEHKDGWTLRGRKDFVYLAPETDAFVVFAREGSEWRAFLVPASGEGVRVEDAGHRMGLRACGLKHVILNRARAGDDALLKFARPAPEAVMEYLRTWWLGMAAIGSGIAKSAEEAARGYAEERYQGTTEIIHHPAVNALMLAQARARTESCAAVTERAALADGGARRSLLAAAQAKLTGLSDAAQAVTDSLQVFGGYGYMEDYRMEKRYRDVNTLKGAGGSARDLSLLIARIAEEGSR
ncbi:MAG TPA: acyl-CoA dehydrogenase [bacterium]|nr:acyl-CoA dehydrogenase [bacterium]